MAVLHVPGPNGQKGGGGECRFLVEKPSPKVKHDKNTADSHKGHQKTGEKIDSSEHLWVLDKEISRIGELNVTKGFRRQKESPDHIRQSGSDLGPDRFGNKISVCRVHLAQHQEKCRFVDAVGPMVFGIRKPPTNARQAEEGCGEEDKREKKIRKLLHFSEARRFSKK